MRLWQSLRQRTPFWYKLLPVVLVHVGAQTKDMPSRYLALDGKYINYIVVVTGCRGDSTLEKCFLPLSDSKVGGGF